MKLDRSTLRALPANVVRPHGRPTSVGVVHFGPGAFHRAHQAAYLDDLAAHDPRWGIAAVSMRSRGTVDALAAQDGLYTLAIRDAEPALRVIGAHRAFLSGSDVRGVSAALADPAVRLVSTTVTEKGYCLRTDGTLDLAHPDVAADLVAPAGAIQASLVGWLCAGLAQRRAVGTAPFTVMPCDNLADNGGKLHAALVAFAAARDPALADWIAGEVRVPSTMVDAITPASDPALRTDVAAALGVDDAIPVQREAFAQWVIEDVGDVGPDLAAAGAIVTPDVAGYERAKLRILNGAHSALAYLGLLRGRASVAEAMRDTALADFVAAMIDGDIIPFLPPVAGLDLARYRDEVVRRFRNPAIVHRLEQIAQDGTLKLPYRLGDTLAANRRAGHMPAHLVAVLGGWVAFLKRRAGAGKAIADPVGAVLADLARALSPAAFVDKLAQRDLGLARWMLDDAPLAEALRAAAARACHGDVLTTG